MHICGIQKNGTDGPIHRAGIELQMQRMAVWTLGGKKWGGMNWEIEADMYAAAAAAAESLQSTL